MAADRPHRGFSAYLVVCCCIGLTTPPLDADVYGLMTDGELADEAELVAEVEFLSSSVGWYDDLPSTEYLARIQRVMKGPAGGGELLLRVPGGEFIPGQVVRVLGTPVFVQGSRALLFLLPNDDGSYSLLHNLMGLFDLRLVDGRVVALRRTAGVRVLGEHLRAPEVSPREAPRRAPRLGRGRRRSRPRPRPVPPPAAPPSPWLTPGGLLRPQALELSVLDALPAMDWGLARDYEGFAAWLVAHGQGASRTPDYYLPRPGDESSSSFVGDSNPDCTRCVRWFSWDHPRYRLAIEWNRNCVSDPGDPPTPDYCGSNGFRGLLDDAVGYWNNVGTIRYSFKASGRSTNKVNFMTFNGTNCCKNNGNLKGRLYRVALFHSPDDDTCGADDLTFKKLSRAEVQFRQGCECWLDGNEDQGDRQSMVQEAFGQTLGLGATTENGDNSLARRRYNDAGCLE